jgi:hypothetical protein
VSKKTIAFTMPATGRGARKREPLVLDGMTGESVPFDAGKEMNLSEEPDDWVRDRDLGRDVDPPGLAGPPAQSFAFAASVTIDLAQERGLMEAMALSFITPFALGWFWWVNAMARPYRLLGF